MKERIIGRPKGADDMLSFTIQAVQCRKSGPQRSDIMSLLLEAKDAETGEPLNEMELISEMIIQLFAGTDTTSVTLSWTLYLLMNHSDKMESLFQELKRVYPQLADVDTMKYSDVQSLPYLNAVLDESMRLYPVAGNFLPRQVPENGAEISSIFVPEGVMVGCSIYAMHRDPSVFSEPDLFLPERWLFNPEDRDAEAKVRLMHASLRPFSEGAALLAHC